MRIEAIPLGENPPHDVNVIVEVPLGGEPVKYEMDKASGTMFVDRILYTAMQYPGNYGFIPHTLSGDGDPVDVLIANHRPIVPGAVISCKPIGVLFMEDEGGADEKLIAVPSNHISGRFTDVNDITDLPDLHRDQIAHFFERYKDLEPGKWVKIVRWGDAAEARKAVVDGIAAATKQDAETG